MTNLLSIKKITLIITTILMTQLSSCATTTNDTVSGVNRTQFMLLPASQVTTMSSQAYTQTLKEAETKKKREIEILRIKAKEKEQLRVRRVQSIILI